MTYQKPCKMIINWGHYGILGLNETRLMLGNIIKKSYNVKFSLLKNSSLSTPAEWVRTGRRATLDYVNTEKT